MTQEPQKSNAALIVIAIIGVVGTIVATTIGVIGNYTIEKLRQDSELTQVALVSIATQGGETQIVLERTVNAPTPTYYLTDAPEVIPTEVIPVSTPTAQSILIPVNESHYSQYKTIELIVDTVDVLPDNTMRWSFSFWNHGAGNVTIGLANERTYLADEAGNRYSVINDDAGNGPIGNSFYTVQPAERQRHSVTFSARVDTAKTFTVGLVSYGCCSATWIPFLVTVNFP